MSLEPLSDMAELRTRCAQLEGELVACRAAKSAGDQGAPPQKALFSVIRTSEMPMILTDPNQHDNPIIFANQAFCDLTGYESDEVIGRNCRFLQGEETDPAAIQRMRGAFAELQPIALNIINYRKDGSRFVNELYISPVYDEVGALPFFLGSQIDITRSVEVSADLLASEHNFRSLFETVNDGLFIIEFIDGPHGPAGDYRHVIINPAFIRNSGLANAMGRTARELLSDEAEEWIAIYRQVLETGKPVRIVRELLSTGCEVEVSAFRMEPASRRRIAVLFEDISARSKAEEDRKELTVQLDALIRSSSEVRYRLNADWSELAELAGGGFIQDSAAGNRNWVREYIPLDYQRTVTDEFTRAIREKNTYRLEHQVNLVDGGVGWALSQAVPVFDDEGEITAWIGAASDITARKLAEEGQRVLNQELTHRIKNTFAIVLAIVTQTLRQSINMGEAREAITARISALGRAQDMLTTTNWVGAEIRDVVEKAIEVLRWEDDQITINGPRYHLTSQQALGLTLAIHELATNAAKYGALSTELGSVTITWSNQDCFRFDWIEAGGPPVVPPKRRGFGSTLMERVIPSYFNGSASLSYSSAGVSFSLSSGKVVPGPIR